MLRAAQGYPAMLGLVVAVLGCQPFDESRPSDATGDPVVAARWRLGDVPDFSIAGGAAPSGDSILFFRILHGVLTPDGGSVISMGGGNNQLVFLDGAGRILALYGRTGAGPGEFRHMTGLHRAGDQVAVSDQRNARITLFSSPVEVQEYSVPFREQHSVGFLADGSFVTTHVPRQSPAPVAEDLIRRGLMTAEGEPRSYFLWNRQGRQVGVISAATQPSPNFFWLVFTVDGRNVGSSYSPPRGCLPWALDAVVGDVLLVADSEAGEVFSVDRHGEATLLLRSSYRNPVTDEAVRVVERWMERTAPDQMAQRGAQGPTEASKRQVRDRIGRPGDPLAPAWSRIVVDSSDRAWLLRASCFSSDPVEIWDVVAKDQGQIATVEIPSNVRVLAVDGDRVLGVLTDEWGVESVAVFRIEELR